MSTSLWLWMNRTVGLRFPECAVRCLDHVKVDVFVVTIVLPVCHIDIGSMAGKH